LKFAGALNEYCAPEALTPWHCVTPAAVAHVGSAALATDGTATDVAIAINGAANSAALRREIFISAP